MSGPLDISSWAALMHGTSKNVPARAIALTDKLSALFQRDDIKAFTDKHPCVSVKTAKNKTLSTASAARLAALNVDPSDVFSDSGLGRYPTSSP